MAAGEISLFARGALLQQARDWGGLLGRDQERSTTGTTRNWGGLPRAQQHFYGSEAVEPTLTAEEGQRDRGGLQVNDAAQLCGSGARTTGQQIIAMSNADCSGNTTNVAEFLLTGLQVVPQMRPFLFLIFMTMYLLIVSGNGLIILTVYMEVNLRSPMYFFLGNLSLLDICATSNVMPTLLSGLLTDSNVISFCKCMIQYFFFTWMASAECLLLTVMAYDRYVAICYPLHYRRLMDRRRCIQFALGSWMTSFILMAYAHSLVSTAEFFGINELDHFFCDLEPLLKVACSDTALIRLVDFILSAGVVSLPFTCIVISYLYIISAILKIKSNKGRSTAFSTCSAHLAVVSTFFGSLIIMYMVPTAGQSLNTNKALSLLYTVATPMTNPFIYALRNKAIMEAFRKHLKKML
ncbi:olfactory receptor 11A1-like [Lissotriton helveticus]